MMMVLIMIICHNVYYRDLPWFAFVHMLKTNERWKRETRKGRREKLKEREGKKRKRNDLKTSILAVKQIITPAVCHLWLEDMLCAL